MVCVGFVSCFNFNRIKMIASHELNKKRITLNFISLYNLGFSVWNQEPIKQTIIFSGSLLDTFKLGEAVVLRSMHLSFDNGNWSELDSLLADTSCVTGVNDVGHVFVGLGCFFHDQFRRCNTNRNTLFFQAVQNFRVVEIAARLGAR